MDEAKNETVQQAREVQELKKLPLRQRLIRIREKELAALVEQWERDGRSGNKPKSLPTSICASLIIKEIPFVLFDKEENTKIAMYLKDEGIYTQNYATIKRVLSWLELTLNNNRADEVIYHIKNRIGVKKKTQAAHLIPVGNGVYNRLTGQLEPFSPNYVFTTKVSTNYVQNAASPVIDGWNVDSWLKSIACNDEEIETLLWQVLNDSLNGNYTRKKATFLVGEGNNGKGTFQDLIKHLVGEDNVAYLKIDQFEEKFSTSVLVGKTVVIGDDVPVGVYVDDSSTFKSVVSGDSVLVEYKNKQPYSTNFQCTVIQSTNGMPRFKDKTTGNLRRILIVPFDADFNGQVENRLIKDEYIKNTAVLEYVLAKAIKMDFTNFIIPKASQAKMESFMADNDPVYDFKVSVFDEWLKLHNLKYIPQAFVYEAYQDFCDRNNYKSLSDRKFRQQFTKYLSSDWLDGQDRKLTNDMHVKPLVDLAAREKINFTVQRDKTYRSYMNNKLKAVN